MSEKRKRFVGVRFTESEYEKMMYQMRLAGYNSLSRYIRKTMLEGRIQHRNLSKNTFNLAREVALFKAELRKIGVNYNQRVKALNTLSTLRDKNGRVVVNWIDIDADNMKMKDLMDRMVKIVLNVEKKVNELESKD